MEKDSDKEKGISKTEKRLAVVNSAAAAVFLVIVSVFLAAAERPTFSETERRNLAELPEFEINTYFSGKYINGIMEYYNDTVPFRDNFKAFSAKCRGLFGISFNDAEFYFDDLAIEALPAVQTTETLPVTVPDTVEETKPAVSQALEATDDNTTQTESAAPDTTQTEAAVGTTQTETAESEEVPDLEITNNIFVLYVDGHWRAMPRFMGGNETIYAESLNSYKKDLDGVNIYSMIIPTQEEYYLPEKYADYVASHYDAIQNLSRNLDEITVVDVYSVLNEHTNEEIYSRTDHHWLPLGAYYSAKEFTKTANADFTELSEYKRVDVEGYLGSLYGQTESPKLLDDPEIFTYYKPQNDYTVYYYTTDYVFEYELPLFVTLPASASYSTFMGGDNKIVRIETDVKNGRRLAVWKDSFGNALIPFLTASFEEIYVLDMRYFKLNAIDFMKEHDITDVLFAMCTFSAVETSKVKLLEENRLR